MLGRFKSIYKAPIVAGLITESCRDRFSSNVVRRSRYLARYKDGGGAAGRGEHPNYM